MDYNDFIFDAPLFCAVCCVFILAELIADRSASEQIKWFKGLVASTLVFIAADFGYTQAELAFITEPGKYNVYELGFWMDWCYNLFCSGVSFFWFMYAKTSFRKHIGSLYKVITIIYLCDLGFAITMIATKSRHLFVDVTNNYLESLFPDTLWAVFQFLPILALFIVAVVEYFDKELFLYREDTFPLIIYPISLIVTCVYKIMYPDSFILMMGMTVALMYLYLSNKLALINTDELTKLANRRQLFREMSDLKYGDKKWCFVMLDADGFKRINDEFGHREGDEALRTMSAILKAASEEYSAKAFRYGGDEFALIKTNAGEEEVDEICREINRRLAAATPKTADYVLSLSYGCMECEGRTQRSIQDIIGEADTNLYAMKKERKEEY